MGITYNDLAQKLQELEQQFGGNSTHNYSGSAKSAIRTNDNFQCFALDTKTSKNESELPVVIAVGANYTQGTQALPSAGTKSHLTSPPWIEDDLGNERKNFESFLNTVRNGNVVLDSSVCSPGDAKELWEPEYGRFKIFTNALQRGDDPWRISPHNGSWKNILPTNYHLVMTNFCPFITNKSWGDYRDYEPHVSQELFSFGLGLGHLTALQQAIGNHTDLWLGHGMFDVYYHFYTYLVRGYEPGFSSLNKNQWLFTCNSRQDPKPLRSKNGLTVCP